MIASWLLYASAMGCLIAFVAVLLERIAHWRNWPTRWIWLSAVVAIVALPIALNLLAKSAVLRYREAYVEGAPVPAPSHSLDAPLLALWLLGSLLIGARLVGTAVALRRRSSVWEITELDGKRVLIAEELGPAVIGWTTLTTVIPRWALALDARSRALMLRHETEHARSGDPYLRTLAMAALVAMPWNPAIWWSMRRLRLAVEIDCDHRLIAGGVDAHAYVSLLLAVGERISATPFAWATALVGSRSSLEKRIIAMVSPLRPRHPRIAIASVGTVVAGIVAVACASPVPDPIVPPVVPSTSAGSANRIYRGTDDSVTLVRETSTRPVCEVYSACPEGNGPDTFIVYRGRDLKFVDKAEGMVRTAVPVRVEGDSINWTFGGNKPDTIVLINPRYLLKETIKPQGTVSPLRRP